MDEDSAIAEVLPFVETAVCGRQQRHSKIHQKFKE